VRVDWPNKSNKETSDFIYDFENEKIYIEESGASYDVLAQTIDGSKIYVEVKSASGSYDMSDKLPIYISPNQWKFLRKVNEKDIYCLARVFSANSTNRRIYYFILTSKFDIKRISNFL
jgi:hypothetical protein